MNHPVYPPFMETPIDREVYTPSSGAMFQRFPSLLWQLPRLYPLHHRSTVAAGRASTKREVIHLGALISGQFHVFVEHICTGTLQIL